MSKIGVILGILGAGILILYLVRAKKEAEVYICPYCGAEFLTLEEIYEHIRIEHGIVPEEETEYLLLI